MHSLSPYSIRCFDPAKADERPDDRFAILSKVGKHDIFTVLDDFLKEQDEKFKIIESTQQVYRFNNLRSEAKNRCLYGWLEAGTYGTKNDIIDISSGKVDFEKAQKHAEIVKHFFYISIPQDVNEGIALLHSFKNNGVKTIIHDLFRSRVKHVVNLNLQMNPLAYQKAYQNWRNAEAKEIRLIKYDSVSDIADKVKGLGHFENELIMKPPRRSTFGKLKELLTPGSEQFKAIELLAPHCRQVKTIVELNGKKRTFVIGTPAAEQVCQIEIPDDEVINVGGNPEFESLAQWARSIHRELSDSIYGKKRAIA